MANKINLNNMIGKKTAGALKCREIVLMGVEAGPNQSHGSLGLGRTPRSKSGEESMIGDDLQTVGT